MTYTPKAFSTLNTEGADVNAVYTVATATSTAFDPSYPAPPFVVGTELIGNNNSKFVFVTVATSCNLGDFVVTTSSYSVTPLTTTLAATSFGEQLGVVMATGTTGQFLWMQIQGQNQASNVVAATTAGVPLYTSATAGRLTSVQTTATNYPVYGVGIYTTATSAQVQVITQLTSIELGLITATVGTQNVAF